MTIVRLAHLSSTIICKLNTCTTYTTGFFCRLYLLPLFGLPIYYASQGPACLPESENCFPAYQGWLSTATRPSTELQTSESNSSQVTTPVVVALPSPPHFPRETLLTLEQAWNSFLDSRLAEWKPIFTLACIFIAISVTTFQIPQVIDDPLTRFFASLAVYRAFTGLIYTPIFSLYFNSKFARSIHFAFLLSKERLEFYSLWTILSLPAAITMWGILFFLFAIISYFWTGQNVTEMSQIDLGFMLRGIILTLILLDITTLYGTWKLLKRFRGSCLHNIRLASFDHSSSAAPV